MPVSASLGNTYEGGCTGIILNKIKYNIENAKFIVMSTVSDIEDLTFPRIWQSPTICVDGSLKDGRRSPNSFSSYLHKK